MSTFQKIPARFWMLSVTLLSLVGPFQAYAAEPEVSPLPDPLVHARFYSWGWVGTPAEPSREEVAARAIARTWSTQQLLRAIPQANAEGRLYLLCVIRRLHPKHYSAALRDARLAVDEPVSVFAGTVLQTQPAGQLIKQLERSRCDPLSWAQGGTKASGAR